MNFHPFIDWLWKETRQTERITLSVGLLTAKKKESCRVKGTYYYNSQFNRHTKVVEFHPPAISHVDWSTRNTLPAWHDKRNPLIMVSPCWLQLRGSRIICPFNANSEIWQGIRNVGNSNEFLQFQPAPPISVVKSLLPVPVIGHCSTHNTTREWNANNNGNQNYYHNHFNHHHRHHDRTLWLFIYVINCCHFASHSVVHNSAVVSAVVSFCHFYIKHEKLTPAGQNFIDLEAEDPN